MGLAARTTSTFAWTLLIAVSLSCGVSSARAQGLLDAKTTYSFHCRGAMALRELDRDVVASWLPDGLALREPSPTDDADTHPVLMIFGTQTDFARHKRVTYYPPFGRCFQEAFVLVPNLRWTNRPSDERVSHYARLYLNNDRATVYGIRLMGWPKIRTRVVHTDDQYEIGAAHAPLITASFDLASAKPLSMENLSFRRIRDMLDQVTVLRHEGRLNRCRLRVLFAPDTLRSVDTRLEWSDGFMPGLPSGERSVEGLRDRSCGAFLFGGCVQSYSLEK